MDGELKYFHVAWTPAIPARMTDLRITISAIAWECEHINFRPYAPAPLACHAFCQASKPPAMDNTFL